MVAISRRSQKATDALELGADEYIATDDGNDWPHRHASSLDLIICTVSSSHMPLQAYLGLLRPKGRFWQVGIPEQALPRLNAMVLVLNGTSLSFSDSASPGNIRVRQARITRLNTDSLPTAQNGTAASIMCRNNVSWATDKLCPETGHDKHNYIVYV